MNNQFLNGEDVVTHCQNEADEMCWAVSIWNFTYWRVEDHNILYFCLILTEDRDNCFFEYLRQAFKNLFQFFKRF